MRDRAGSPRYLSTRDPDPSPQARSFADALLAGLAPDGGLYLPVCLPRLDAAAWRACAGLRYDALAAAIVGHFAGDSFAAYELQELTAAAYRGFRHAAVAPLRQLDERL